MGRGKQKSKARPKAATATPSVAAQVITAPSRDPRRWIYGGLDLAFALMQAILIWKVVPNRLPSASIHLWTLPIATLVMGIATLVGGPRAWLTAVIAGSAALVSTFFLIVRIIVSAAFLSGVYGAFGKAASMTALTSIAIVVELVALLPIVQVKWLMTRMGRRTFGRS